MTSIGRPREGEAAPFAYTYIDLVPGDNAPRVIEAQLDQALSVLSAISEERSLYRYAPEKWSIRQLLSHISDTERVFAFRTFWFARGFQSPLPGFDQQVGVAGAEADAVPWPAHLEEFRRVRLSTISFFAHLPEEAWLRRGVASGNPFSVRAGAFMIAGHLIHHLNLLSDRYL